MRKNSGLFITFEGTEGAGKSTLIRELAAQLVALGIPENQIVITREPGGTAVAEQIRKTLLEQDMSAWTELFLYEAARAEHLRVTLLPALSQSKIVLCDRFADSSLAYQAHARGLPWKLVKQLNTIATQGLTPNATVLLNIDPAIGLARAQDRNRFEEEGLAFQKKVRAGFLKSQKENPKRWIVMKPGSRNPKHLGHDLLQLLQKKFSKELTSKQNQKLTRKLTKTVSPHL